MNLKPKTYIKIGPNYLVDESEMEKCFKEYTVKQQKFYIEKVNRVKILGKSRKQSC